MYNHSQTQILYHVLKGLVGKAELVSEEAIKNELGEKEFNSLRHHGFIEYCGTLNNCRMYAV